MAMQMLGKLFGSRGGGSGSPAPITAEVVRRHRERLSREYAEERDAALALTRMYAEELARISKLDEEADFWLKRPIQKCLMKLDGLDTHKLDEHQKQVLNLLVSCHRNYKSVLEDLREYLALCQRIDKANSCLQKMMSVEDIDILHVIQQRAAESPQAREEERTTAADASGKTRTSTTSGRSIDANQSLVMSVCSTAMDEVKRERSLLRAYKLLMKSPKSAALLHALEACFLDQHQSQSQSSSAAEGAGASSGGFSYSQQPYEEFDMAGHNWLEAWIRLTNVLQAISSNYLVLSRDSPAIVLECVKVIEIHENVARNVAEAMPGGNFLSMMSVLNRAAKVYREPRHMLNGQVYQVQDNLVDLLVRSLSNAVSKRVNEVAQQAFYREESCETRNLVLDALVEDIYRHHEEINPLFPERYKKVFPLFYSQSFANCLKDLTSKLEPLESLVDGSSSNYGDSNFLPQQQQQPGISINFSNADILSLITWVERFVTATLKLFSSCNTEDASENEQVRETLHGDLLFQLDVLRKAYVQRASLKLKEWMRSILAKEESSLQAISAEQAACTTEQSLPLLSSAPIDVFSAVQSELHTTLEDILDPTLAAWSACAMAGAISQHADDYKSMVASFAGVGDHPKPQEKKKKATAHIRRHHSSPAAFIKTLKSQPPRFVVARTTSTNSVHSHASEAGEIPIERYCIIANSCSVYHQEASEVVRLVQKKFELWQVPSQRSEAVLVLTSKTSDESMSKFEELMQISILRFQKACTLSLQCLVEAIFGDLEEVLLELFSDAWVLDQCQCIETVCATFHDYCTDINEYLKPDVYSQFLSQLFESLVDKYTSELMLNYTKGRLTSRWEQPAASDVTLLLDCAALVVNINSNSNSMESARASTLRNIRYKILTIRNELAKMLTTI